jgi:myosin heavy subunit
LRAETLGYSAIIIQKVWRGYVARKRYLHICQSIRMIQSVGRAFIIYRRIKYLQMHRAIICLQTNWRRTIAQRRFSLIRDTVIAIQSHYRAAVVRTRLQKVGNGNCFVS